MVIGFGCILKQVRRKGRRKIFRGEQVKASDVLNGTIAIRSRKITLIKKKTKQVTQVADHITCWHFLFGYTKKLSTITLAR